MSNERAKEAIKKHLLSKGVENLKKFGYPGVNSKNIVTDKVYSMFFKSMLEETIDEVTTKDISDAAKELLNAIN